MLWSIDLALEPLTTHPDEWAELFFIISLLFLFSDPNLSSEQSDWLSTLFDVGGIIGESPTTLLFFTDTLLPLCVTLSS